MKSEALLPVHLRYACVFVPTAAADTADVLMQLARDFSSRFEMVSPASVVIQVSGLERLLGDARAIGQELRRAAAERHLTAHVALAATWSAALILARARPGLTIAPAGEEAARLAPLPIEALASFTRGRESTLEAEGLDRSVTGERGWGPASSKKSPFGLFLSWGLRTLGDLAALPSDDLVARLGSDGAHCQMLARGQDHRPLVPALPEERFDGSIDLEWPIEGLEPLSFVLTRLLEPLSTRLERRDRGVAVIHLELRPIRSLSAEGHASIVTRRLELPAPMRDVRTLRTLILLDLESHLVPAPIDRVTIHLEPTPARVLQHTLFSRAHPTPEQLSTLLARLGALMGQDRIGRMTLVDTYRPGAFAMEAYRPPISSAFLTARGCASLNGVGPHPHASELKAAPLARAAALEDSLSSRGPQALVSALRRYRRPIPARIVVTNNRPVHVTTDRRGFSGGRVIACAGPWRTSGDWWIGKAGGAGQAGGVGRSDLASWDRDEWDVSLADGAVYRIFCERQTTQWFIEAIVD